MSKRRDRKVQYAVLPFRPGPTGLEILLITSRETKRWVMPKGWPMKKKKPHETAATEALEEAGVEGAVAKDAIGVYRYDKRLKSGKLKPTEVTVFPFRVEVERDKWPEMKERERRWFAPAEAASLVDEPELKALICAFARVELQAEALDGNDGAANPGA